jgi:TP901 family phage tail tape measure protein
MGITADGIVKFTDTVTKFASVTGVSADTVAQKFGRIAQLTKLDPSQFENLGSSISFAGVNAVATEAEIMSLAESIAAVSNRVGVLAPEVIGLSTSLASLGIAPEQARGVFTRVFADIDRSVAKGGTQLDNFAKVSGMSSAAFKQQWGTPGQSYEVFRRILEGLNKSGKDMTQTFDDLNLTETREVNTLTRLATNLDVVDSSMQNAKSSFTDNVFLSDSFAKTVDNLDSKLKIFKNRIDSLTASLSKGLVAGLSIVLDYGSALANMFKILANNPVLQIATSFTTGLLALGAVGAGIVSIMAKVVAQIYAFRVATINSANDPTAVTGMARQLKALTNYKNEIIEMRDQISLSETSGSIRGQITPINYPVRTMNKDYSKYLLEQENIYRATGVAAI